MAGELLDCGAPPDGNGRAGSPVEGKQLQSEGTEAFWPRQPKPVKPGEHKAYGLCKLKMFFLMVSVDVFSVSTSSPIPQKKVLHSAVH